MPLYEYRCKKCGVFEWIHNHDVVLSDCPTCDGHVVKLISASNFVMDGKMQNQSPNHPDRIQEGKELRKKHTKDNTLKEWKQENLAKKKVDGKITY